MKRYALVLILVLLLDGCAEFIGPQDNRDFYRVSQLAEFAGVYKNEGKGGETNLNFHHYLSVEIWGSDFPVMNAQRYQAHAEVEFIEVTSADNSLTAKAIQNGCVVYEKTYIIGKDFDIKNGQLVIHKRIYPLGAGSGNVIAGPAYEEITLGIDTGKQGKARSTYYQAGLIFLLIPYAGSMTQDVRFERVSDKPQGYRPCVSH
jgi:hypothetical protein